MVSQVRNVPRFGLWSAIGLINKEGLTALLPASTGSILDATWVEWLFPSDIPIRSLTASKNGAVWRGVCDDGWVVELTDWLPRLGNGDGIVL